MTDEFRAAVMNNFVGARVASKPSVVKLTGDSSGSLVFINLNNFQKVSNSINAG